MEAGNVEFEDILAGSADRLLAFARALSGDRGTAEDIVQDVLLKLWTRRDDLAEISDLHAYARRMVVNSYLSWGRKWFRVQPVASPEVRMPRTTDAAAQVVDHQLLIAEIRKLPRRQRTVLVLRYFVGLDDGAIADDLGCSPSTVRSHASRALAALRVELSTEPVPVRSEQ